MPTKKKSAKAVSTKDLERKLKKTQLAHRKQRAVLNRIRKLLRAAERLVNSLSTPPPATEF